jgi:serine/threonine protein kinase
VGTVIFCAPEQRWTLENSSSGGGEKPPDSFVRGQHPTTSTRPEVYEYDYRSDIFAVGVVLYNCATKSIPGLSLAQKHEFEEEMKNSNDVERKKVRARLVTTLNMVQHVSQQLKDKTAEHFPHHFQNQDLKDMMFKLLDCNPKSRISVEEIMDHRAFSETQGGRQIDLFTPSDLENMKIYSKLNKYRAVYHSEMVEENFKPKAHQIEWGYRDPTKPKPAEADAFQVTQLEPDYITHGEYFFNACNVPVQYVNGSNHGTPTSMNNNNNQNNSKQKFYDQQNNVNNGGNNNMQYAGAPQYGMYNNFMQPAQQQ